MPVKPTSGAVRDEGVSVPPEASKVPEVPTVEHFDREENFKDLVFQPDALRPLIPALKKRQCKICVLGGSISLQQRGYRPNLVRALQRRGVVVEDLPAAVGTAGCRPLSLVVNDLVLTKQPDLLMIEVAVNDGDELLESTPSGASAPSILQAAEGIVRTVRKRCPSTAIVFLEMFLRDDGEARVLKTGSEAWRDSRVEEAIQWYHEVAPSLHRQICHRYALTQINLVPAFRSLSCELRQKWFRDDCHHSDLGGEAVGNLLARLILWSVRQAETSHVSVQWCRSIVEPPLDPLCWCNGKTIRILPGWVTSGHGLRRDKDLLRLGQQTDWLLLYAGGKATIPFKGRACGLMTLLGPDAPSLKVQVDGDPSQQIQLFDRWCYYWRDAVVLLCDGLPDTTHTLQLEVEACIPDATCLKRPANSELWAEFRQEAETQGRAPQKLWLSYACAVESDESLPSGRKETGDVVGVRRRIGDWSASKTREQRETHHRGEPLAATQGGSSLLQIIWRTGRLDVGGAS
eukprot:symbB.v1.2.007364.t1/scaffold451.1/size378644/10